MDIRIINIGDELLIGQVVNTNASFMCSQLLKNGFHTEQTVVCGDNGIDILNCIVDAFKSVDAVILTGGLGPTKDDITKKIICDYFNDELTLHQPTLDFVTSWLEGRGVAMSETNRSQAMVPSKATVLPNPCGTAPGIWMEEDGKVLISLPGVPYEMERLLTEEVIPALQKRFIPDEHYICKVVQTLGIGESTLSDILEPWEVKLPPHITLAYLPDSGIIRLRLTGHGTDANKLEAEMQTEMDKLCTLAAPYIFAKEDKKMNELVADLLLKQGKTLATAESCTGGYIAHLITSIPGSSQYFKGSVVSYANSAKINLLNVSSEDIFRFGVVSQPVVEQMAEGARKAFGADFAIATDGIAGPTGATQNLPVGSVWIAVASASGVKSQLFTFGNAGGRSRVIYRAAIRALDLVRRELTNYSVTCTVM